MAYSDDILALSPDHIWAFDGNSNDSVGTLNGVETSMGAAAAISEDATNSRATNATGDRVALATATDVDQALTRKAIGGWFLVNSVQPPPKSIYREGTTGNQFCFVMWAGNALMLDIVNGGTITQLFADRVLQPNRAYHLMAVVEGTGFADEVSLYLDGVLQQTTTLGAVDLADRNIGEWADPSGATEVGNQTVLLNAPNAGRFQYWASWGNKVLPTGAEIRSELFEKGALPGITISSDTEVNMQAALDAIADTVRPDEPLNIRIEDVTGGGTLNLSADNITHSPLASIHVQFVGTGTLNYTNTNGANASIGSTPNGGTINFINPAVLTVSPLEPNSEVRVYEAGTVNEVAGIENSGTSFATSISVNTVDVVVHSLAFKYVRRTGIDMTSGDVSLPIRQIPDPQYENP